MKLHVSGEEYLEAVLILQKKQGMVRSIDLARHMGFSNPSISHAVGVLKNGGFEGHFKAAVLFALKRDDALALADTAAYRRELP